MIEQTLDIRLDPSVIKLLPIFEAGPAWMRRRDLPCAPIDGVADPLWTSDQPGDSVRAAKICTTRCPVRAECDMYATQNGECFGVWGGLNRSSQATRTRTASTRKAA
ncbi:WhiB family transcriptional regulator [Actinoplanes sp. NPDC051851]|uniref:WhiB family transcriptional regulator n=1 Tax=Actinoplanes sp. NPDC051851 TaxID=3154753 RepID=UPI00342C9361